MAQGHDLGSARTNVDHPTYVQARDLAARLAEAGWMVVTGAGPGIMSADLEGAGRASFSVNIRLLRAGAEPVHPRRPEADLDEVLLRGS